MQPITITADMANSIWAYLASKPFGEVGNLAVAFQQMVGSQMAAIEAAAKEETTGEPVEEVQEA